MASSDESLNDFTQAFGYWPPTADLKGLQMERMMAVVDALHAVIPRLTFGKSEDEGGTRLTFTDSARPGRILVLGFIQNTVVLADESGSVAIVLDGHGAVVNVSEVERFLENQ